MILEVAILDVKPGMAGEFAATFKIASTIIASMSGYISHELQRCIETENRYILLVRWQKLEDHTIGFRQSLEYQQWRSLLHHFYEPFPTVEHYTPIDEITSPNF
ncbi:antibiotic biosynthesis monooxygenase [Calothrix sp. UHCC 0171]|uniref:antibiotic biosynthesis monooxygenase family protein n=1 Tax=Calothrix sp. UHCC 0171 TaxID=3110245 RepID=UPI002B21F1E9|nr:antibiotic biosynthesis monooxygenase [Calothrix sp. UHCC 0171]MEA5573792.1 antibiotic biosynthesis monooxygenase [Calothrix sp. UHCC 0171]